MQFQVGVIGATGYIGTPYRQEIRECDNARIVALCARRRPLLEAAQQEDGAPFITDDWREVVEHPDVNFVVVATPDALHIEPMLACATRGQHVLCEKPIGMNVGEARKIHAAYDGSKLAHFVPFWTRFIPLFARTKELVQEGALGEIRAMVYRWHNPRPTAMPFTWRDNAELSSAGSIADVGSHAYDTMRWLLDEEAVRVFAHADVITPAKPDLGEVNLEEALQWGEKHIAADTDRQRQGTAFDYANIAFELQGGAVGVLVLSHAPFLRKGLAPEVELHGTDASLSIDRAAGTLTIVRAGNDPEILYSEPFAGFGNRFRQHVFPALQSQMDDGATGHPNLHDGWRVQLFTDAAALSARRGEWVKLSELE